MLKLIAITLTTVIGLGATQASAENRNFRLANRSNHTITQVLASNIGDPAFVPVDLLGDETIPPNDSLVIAPFNAQGWCRFDLLITFANDDQEEVYDVNVCAATKLTTYGDGDNSYARVSYN